MNTRRLSPAFVTLLLAVATPGGAQVIRQPIGTPRLPPAPAAVLSSINQVKFAISAQVWFQVPTGTASILVSRAVAGGTPSLVTPNPVPLASVPTLTGQYYYWIDNTLNALGSYSYTVAAIQGDGRSGVSTPMAYTPLVGEPQNVRVTKTDPWTAVVTFDRSLPEPQTYRLYGTGLVSYGVQAVVDVSSYSRGNAVTVGNLAAGTYNWVLRAEYVPGIRTTGVPVVVTFP